LTTAAPTLKGSLVGIIFHDVCEEMRLEEVRRILDAKRTAPTFKHPTPEYLHFENPPIVESLDCITVSGEHFETQAKYYDYGVVSVLMELSFEGDWRSLANLAAQWVPSAELERRAEEIVRSRMSRIAPAMVRPYPQWLGEDYYVFLLTEVVGQPLGAELLRE